MSFSLSQFVWLGITVLDVIVITALVRRDLSVRMPELSAFVSFDLLREIIGYYVYQYLSVASFNWFYYSAMVVEYVLTYLLLLVLWKHGLRHYRGIWSICRWTLGLTFVTILLLVQTSNGYGLAPPRPGAWLSDWLRLVDRSVMFTQAASLLAFFAILGRYRVQISAVVRGLAVSWFFYSLVNVGLYSWRYAAGNSVHATYSAAKTLVYLGLLAAWSGILWLAHEERVVEVSPVFVFRSDRQTVVEQMERMNRTLVEIWKA